jgi:hypothetical protein
MHNVTCKTEGDILTITIDLSKNSLTAAKPSSTGKTLLVASTSGTLPVASPHAPVSVSLNVTTKAH